MAPNEAQLGCTKASFGKSTPYALYPEAIDKILATEIYFHLSKYTERKLSYYDDILNAFSGMFDAFKRDIEEYIHNF
jgi:hypothetical protein